MYNVWKITTHAIHLLTVVIEMSRGVRLVFAAENQVGFCQITGEVIIKKKTQNTLHKYKLQFLENVYLEIWSEDFPHGVNTASVIGVERNSFRLFIQDNSTSATLTLSSDGRKCLDSMHHEGILLTCLLLENFVYAVEKTEGEYEIAIVDKNVKYSDSDSDKDRSEIRLQPVAAKSTWSHPYLSLCEDISGDRVAVISTDHSLDIYDKRK